MQNLRYWIGSKFLKIGSIMLFDTDLQRDKFKHAINHNSYLGAMAGSGGHLLAHVNPMCEFDIISTISVMKHEEIDIEREPITKEEFYYKENWLG